jgi:hypothetical protein
MLLFRRKIIFNSVSWEVYMSCPYFDEVFIGTCAVATSQYAPSIDKMETYCVKQAYRLCPTLREFLYENDKAMADRPQVNKKLYAKASFPQKYQCRKM